MLQEKESKGLVLANLTDLKEFEKLENQFVEIVDVKQIEDSLQVLADKYKDLKITPENYKGAGADAEKELRDIRYSLQNIEGGNKIYLNNLKKTDSKKFGDLIKITRVVEDRLSKEKKEIIDAENLRKAKEKKEEEERVAKIEERLEYFESEFKKKLINSKTREDLDSYDKLLNEIIAEFPEFKELQYKAEKIDAIYSGRRKEVVQQVEEFEKIEQEKLKFEEEKKALDADKAEIELQKKEKREKLTKFRVKVIEAKGLILSELSVWIYADEIDITANQIENLDEMEWFDEMESLDSKINDYKIALEDEAENKIKTIVDSWNSLLVIFEGLGGKKGVWKLKKDEIPTSEKIDDLKLATKQLQEKKKHDLKKMVKKEIEPFGELVDSMMVEYKRIFEKTKFKNEYSKNIAVELFERITSIKKEIIE